MNLSQSKPQFIEWEDDGVRAVLQFWPQDKSWHISLYGEPSLRAKGENTDVAIGVDIPWDVLEKLR